MGKKVRYDMKNFKVCNFSIKPYNLIIIYIRLDYIMQCLNPLNNVCRASLVTHRECLDTVSIADLGRLQMLRSNYTTTTEPMFQSLGAATSAPMCHDY